MACRLSNDHGGKLDIDIIPEVYCSISKTGTPTVTENLF